LNVKTRNAARAIEDPQRDAERHSDVGSRSNSLTTTEPFSTDWAATSSSACRVDSLDVPMAYRDDEVAVLAEHEQHSAVGAEPDEP
jgi:hypothetical protein